MKIKILFYAIVLTVSISFFASHCFAQDPNWLWTKSAEGMNLDWSSTIKIDASGNTYLAGEFQSSAINFGSVILKNKDNTGNSSDIFIMEFDEGKNLLWAKSFGGNGFDFISAFAVDKYGDIYITGEFQSPIISFGTNTLTNSDKTGKSSDVFIAKCNSNGNILWAKSVGGAGLDKVTSIALDTSGYAYITGYFQSSVISFGTYSLKNTGSYNMFLAEYDEGGNVLWAKSILKDSKIRNDEYIASVNHITSTNNQTITNNINKTTSSVNNAVTPGITKYVSNTDTTNNITNTNITNNVNTVAPTDKNTTSTSSNVNNKATNINITSDNNNIATTSTEKKYFIIASSYKTEQEAKNAVDVLKAKGFPNAVVVGKSEIGLYRIAYSSFISKDEALPELNNIKQSENKSAWLYEKK